jgi:ABC-2 type transport system ATP-binding protein
MRAQTRTTIHARLERGLDGAPSTLLHDLRLDGASLTATVESSRIGEVMALLTPLGIEALTVAPPSLESLFLRLYDAPVVAEAAR